MSDLMQAELAIAAAKGFPSFSDAEMIECLAGQHFRPGPDCGKGEHSGTFGRMWQDSVSDAIASFETVRGVKGRIRRERISGIWHVRVKGFEGSDRDVLEAAHLALHP